MMKILFLATLLLASTFCRYRTFKVPISKIKRQKLTYITKFHYKDGGKMFFNVKKSKKSNSNPEISLDVEIVVYKTGSHEKMRSYGNDCSDKTTYAWRKEHMQIHNDGIPW